MALITLDGTCNSVKTDVDVQGESGFNLGDKTWTAAEERTSNAVKPPVPCDFVLMAAVASGAITLKTKAHDSADDSPSFSTPSATLTLAAATDTEIKAGVTVITEALDAVSINGVAGGGGGVLSKIHGYFTAPLAAGQGTRQSAEGWNNLGAEGGNDDYAAVTIS